MRKEVVLITGANGEIGHGLITHLGEQGNVGIVALDVSPLDESLKKYCERFIQGDILDTMILGRLVSEFEIRTIYHLASILSTKAEYNPETAHRINVEGTLNLLRLAVEQAAWQSRPVKFLYPSSIAVYGLPDLKTKEAAGKVKENEYLQPTTMYGCNKLYCEHLGRYYSSNYRQLAADRCQNTIDFRCLRFPGLVSAVTIPTGGTSDYGPEMLHHAAQGIHYDCFVRPDTRLPFMVMPDAIKSILDLEAAPAEKLTQRIYNVTSFCPTAQEFYDIILKAFPNADVDFKPHASRQGIVDTWPCDIDDSAARRDWNWKPSYNQERSFDDYLLPAIRQRYAVK
ncbi:nucleoside-diphosphate-sugar epimerase [Longilinea arvoryzae]|uniref:Nucleoside-diphosphate-sugar epimerase n=1 Tax=Longilinea arvoryzae TaxID=360412 RepID=A0A0S7BGV5_9CHLR|nr:NAD-dependent epimerase/dehydratase family protein [Longilinea arvoryzae]GAP14845.1 nucleoside-diphosphate-sugar epimerase [Longilinea arvoryzae]